MKICDLTQSYNPTSGGIRTYIHEKRRYIQNHTDHEHVLIVPGPENAIERDRRATVYTIKSPFIPGAEPFRFLYKLHRVLEILKKENPDIIELGDAYLLPHVAYWYRRGNPRVKVVGYYHTDFPTAYVEPAMRNLLNPSWGRRFKKLSTWYARQVYKKCNAILTASRALYKKLSAVGIPNVHFVNLGVDSELFHPEKRDMEWRRQLNIQDDQVLLFYHGRFDEEKRVQLVAEAFEKSAPKFNGALMMVGEGPQKASMIEFQKKHPNIHIQPFETNRDILARAIASADVYVTAGPHETFGLSVLEAQACGLPVLGVKAGALRERVNPRVGALVKPDSVDDMAEHMFTLCTDGYRQKGRNARKLVEERYTWHESFKGIFNVYQNL